MKSSFYRYLNPVLATSFTLLSLSPAAHAAQEVAFVSGAFKRTISVTDIEYLAKTGKGRGFLSGHVVE